MKRPIWLPFLAGFLAVSCGGTEVPDDLGQPDDGVPDVRVDVVITVDYGYQDTGSDEGRDTFEGDDVFVDTGEDTAEEDTGIIPGTFGWPCEQNGECFIGYCVQAAEGSICTRGCYEEGDCPDSWKCRAVASGGDPIYICVPTGVFLCRPCEKNDDCSSNMNLSKDRCVVHGSSGNFCGTSCGEAGDPPCPNGFTCEQVSVVGGETVNQCIPETGECTCSESSILAGASTTCFVSNANGVCTGVRECLESGLTPCDARNPAVEACNKVDDDCDGVTDNPGSVGCTPYYVDNDQDGWGIGIQHCVCGDEAPIGYSTKPGDCNDSSLGMNPAAKEFCNGMDDDCDGETDEYGSTGCRDYSLDNDGDGFGQPGEKRCTCGPVPPFTGTVVGDCDDTNSAICPDSNKCKEKCDGIDNDCDGATDNENALMCMPYYFDGDQDTYGLPSKFKCLCAPSGLYTATRAGDCVDNDPLINSTGDEICNGVDDNCNGRTDEGDVADLCPPAPGVEMHGSTVCDKVCKVGVCDPATTDGTGGYVPGWFDLNETISDGCECQADMSEQFGGQTCNTAVDLGAVPDSGFRVASDDSTGSVVPKTDEDWYRFQASDPTWNGETESCDFYNVKVKFTKNPGSQYMFDIYRGSCAAANQICGGALVHEWATNFSTGTGTARKGECPCSSASSPGCSSPLDYSECIRVESNPLKCGSCPGYGAANMNFCSDNSSAVYLRVYRDPLKTPTCEDYELEISNGLYQFSGS
ncbi:MAG TPA: putative metal-binding motif-containing protein [Myxococcota bacterium]|nr:putative metal-binding motif-containing protein [Myxococcota bacterium]HQP94951.1 putative metal-binding motif-containing protein [Myxococcota bacterium]